MGRPVPAGAALHAWRRTRLEKKRAPLRSAADLTAVCVAATCSSSFTSVGFSG